MPKLVHSVPKYRRHRASGQAVVTIGAKDRYLGPYRSKASLIEYDRLIAEWLANDRQGSVTVRDRAALTVTEVLAPQNHTTYDPTTQWHYAFDASFSRWACPARDLGQRSGANTSHRYAAGKPAG